MRINFNQQFDRIGTSCKRWDLIMQQYPHTNLIPMGIADMDLPSPPEIITAIQERLQHPCFGYTYPMDSLLDTIQASLKTQFHWKIPKEWIILYPDATFSLNHILQKLQSSQKKKIILQPPVFGPFFTQISEAGYQALNNPLSFIDNNYYMDFEHLKQLFHTHHDIHSFLLCNPHNPIGRVWTQKELFQLGELCVENNILIITDELHSSLIYPNYHHISIGSINQEFAQNSITIMSSGKTFNMPGLKISFIIVPNPTIREKLQHSLSDPNILGMVAYEAALKAGEEYYIKELMDHISNNFAYVQKFIHTNLPQLNIITPQATFLVWLDMRALQLSAQQLDDFLIQKAHIFATNGASFGEGGTGFMRFNIAMPLPTLQKALIQLESAINEFWR